MKLSDYVANFLAEAGIRHVFSVCGGGSMHLVNSIGSNPRLKYVACHHEQAAAISAEAYSRIRGLGCALFTTGPGGTNSVTGVACAWIDSIPVIYISGQVMTHTLMAGTGVRQYGIQETDIVSIVKSITKYAVCIRNAEDIRHELEKALWTAKHGRPGPVWLDIPLDIQAKDIDPEKLKGFDAFDPRPVFEIQSCIDLLTQAERPVLLVGAGASGSNLIDFISALNIPVITSWAGCELVGDHLRHIGNIGLFGDRASNFAIQKADLVLALGCRMSVGITGHDTKNFAKNAKVIMVDIDPCELDKPSLRLDLKIQCYVSDFIGEMLKHPLNFERREWIELVNTLKLRYPVCLPEYEKEPFVNPYVFADKLSDRLGRDAVITMDVGMSYNCVYQAAKMKLGQRWVNGNGHSTMGYAIPAAIGAAFASGRKVVCLVGDGGLQMNVQELATISHNKLPIRIFVFNNQGYIALEVTQDNHFKNRVGVDNGSGLGFPDLQQLANAYKLRYRWCRENKDIDAVLDEDIPYLCELVIDPAGKVIPKVFGRPLEDMFPYLPRKEFHEIMEDEYPESLKRAP